jgi:hypothetical protein
VIIEKFIDEA